MTRRTMGMILTAASAAVGMMNVAAAVAQPTPTATAAPDKPAKAKRARFSMRVERNRERDGMDFDGGEAVPLGWLVVTNASRPHLNGHFPIYKGDDVDAMKADIRARHNAK